MHAVAQLKCHKEKDKGLYVWSRTGGLRQTVGREVRGKEELPIPDTLDPISVLEYIGKQQKGLFVLCDYSPYLAPYGQQDPLLDVQMQKLEGNGVTVEVDERTREQLVQALLGLTETDIENVLAKAIISGGGLTAEALPVVLDENWWKGLSDDERRQAEAEARSYEDLSEEERDRIWNDGAESLEEGAEGDEVDLPTR